MRIKIFQIILFLFFILNILSCGENSKSNRKDKIIPQKTFTQLLIKIHLADAIITNNNLSDVKLSNDSLSYYNQIFKEFDITREQFYFSLKYYVQHIDKFNKIQNAVVDTLNNRYNLLDSLEKINLKKVDLWKLKRYWEIPKDGEKITIPFRIKAKEQGIYTLNIDLFSFADDISLNLKMKIVAYYEDGSFSKKEVKLVGKKEQWKEYSVFISTNPNKVLKEIGGEILSHSKTTTYMHLKVKNILLNFKDFEDASKNSRIKETENNENLKQRTIK